jgi:hypothetical protein
MSECPSGTTTWNCGVNLQGKMKRKLASREKIDISGKDGILPSKTLRNPQNDLLYLANKRDDGTLKIDLHQIIPPFLLIS